MPNAHGIKIFHGNKKTVERSINRWLATENAYDYVGKPLVNIVHVTQTVSLDPQNQNQQEPIITTTIFFTEVER